MTRGSPNPIISDDSAYAVWRDLVLERTGLMFGPRRRESLGRAIAERSERAGCTDLEQYCSRLKASPTDSPVWDDLVKALTICETYFFREPEQIEALRTHILPELIARHETDRTLRIWSAGCATGEEAYTLAILLRQVLADLASWSVLILGTDINRQALHAASVARYRDWSFRQVDPELRRRYFQQHGEWSELNPDIRGMVKFAYLNLADDVYPSETNHTASIDLILCRNVSIYLPEKVTRSIAQRFWSCLSPGGWLMVGPSEAYHEYYSQFRLTSLGGAVAYQKGWNSPAKALDAAAPVRMRPRSGERKPSWSQLDFSSPTLPDITAPSRVDLNRPVRSSAAPAAAIHPSNATADPDPQRLCEDGLVHLKNRRYEEARHCLVGCLKANPDHAHAKFLMARLEANLRRLDHARQWAHHAVAADPLRSEAHYVLGLVMQEQGEPELALASFKKAVYLDADFALAHFSLANLYQRAGKEKEATRHRAQAVKLARSQSPETVLPGSEDVTAGRLLALIEASA